MKIFLVIFILLISFNQNLVAWNLHATTSNDKNIIFETNVNYSTLSEINNHNTLFNYSTELSIKNFDVNGFLGSFWDFSNVQRTKDSLILLYMSSPSSDSLALSFFAYCININDITRASQYYPFNHSFSMQNFSNYNDVSADYRMKCHTFPSVYVAIQYQDDYSFNELIAILDEDAFTSAAQAFSSDCDNNILDCSYKAAAEKFNEETCKASFNNYEYNDYIKTDYYEESELDCVSKHRFKEITYKNVRYTIEEINSVKSTTLENCFNCVVKDSTYYLSVVDKCELMKEKAKDVCSLQNEVLDDDSYTCELVDNLYYDESYTCIQLYTIEYFEDSTYDAENKTLTTADGKKYIVNDDGELVDENGDETGYYLRENEDGSYEIEQGRATDEIVEDIENTIDESSEELEEALKDCVEYQYNAETDTEECIEYEDTTESIAISIMSEFYDKLIEAYSVTNFLDDFKIYKPNNYNFNYTVDLTDVCINSSCFERYEILSRAKLDSILGSNIIYFREFLIYIAYMISLIYFLSAIKS